MVAKTGVGVQAGTSNQDRTGVSSGSRNEPVVCFVGTSNSGKTTLLEQVVRELKSRGVRLAVIKHAHDAFDVDRPGKDSWRLARAGCDVVALCSPDGVAIFEPSNTEPRLADIAARFHGMVDIVIGEGFKESEAPKIIVLGHGQERDPFVSRGTALARVRARLSPTGSPLFDCDDILGVTGLLLDMVGGGSSPVLMSQEVNETILQD